MGDEPPKKVDFAIITIIPEAYEAVRTVFGLNDFDARDGYEWAWTFLRKEGKTISIAAGLALDRENVAAATFTNSLLHAWEPDHLLLVDIGGAVQGRDDVQLGDVVAHTHLHYYDFNKETGKRSSSPRYLPHAAPSSKLREMSRRPSLRGDQGWTENIPVKRPTKGVPKVLPGEMLVGGTLFANSSTLKRLLKKHPKVIAVEMEGVGVARGVLDWSTRGQSPEFLIIRGMSDFCNAPPAENQRTRDRWKRYAAYAAAAHALDLVLALPLSSTHPSNNTPDSPTPQHTDTDNLWQEPGRNLIGRDVELTSIVEVFSMTRPRERAFAQRRHVICGEAGIGKSALALQVAACLGSVYQIRWWLDGGSKGQIRAGLRELARQLGVESASLEIVGEYEEDSTSPRFLRDLRQFLEKTLSPARLLVIIDNVDDPDLKRNIERDLLVYLPARTADVLITSQSRRWHPLAQSTYLTGLDAQKSADLIASEMGVPEIREDPVVLEICSLYGGRPLFLKQVAVLLADGDEPQKILHNISASPDLGVNLFRDRESFDPLLRNIYYLSLERADRSLPCARRAAEIIAFLGAEPIPENLGLAISDHIANGRSEIPVLSTLFDRSLLMRHTLEGNRLFQMHRTVAAVIRTLVTERGAVAEALEATSYCVEKVVPNVDRITKVKERGQIVAFRKNMDKLNSHLSAFLDHVREGINFGLSKHTVQIAADAGSSLGMHLWMLSEWDQLETVYENSANFSEAISDVGTAALRRMRLGNVFRQIGRFDRAHEIVRENLPLMNRHGDNLDYAWGKTVLARILRNKPDPDPRSALVELNEAYDIFSRSIDRDSNAVRRNVSSIHNYRSVIYRQLADLEAAERESEAGLRELIDFSDLSMFLGSEMSSDDELVAMHIRALGGIWRMRGDFQRAMIAHQRALQILESVYQRDHNDIVRALDSLGRVEREWGELDSALGRFNRASEISARLLGEHHAHVGTASVNLALTLLEMERWREAFECADRGYQIYRVAYSERNSDDGFRHESTAWSLFVRAEALGKLGKNDSSLRDHQRVLRWREINHGESHSLVASSLFAVAEATDRHYGMSGREVVICLHRRAWEIRQRVFGERPNYWLAQSQSQLGFYLKDIDMLRSAYIYFSNNLREGHWRTELVRKHLENLLGAT